MRIDEGITLRKLEVLLRFLEHGQLGQVAESLDQSTVSIHRALHSLEEALRCPLFRREGRTLVPLPAAHVLAEHAARAIDACATGIHKARECAGFGGSRLRVGSLYSLTVRTLPHLLIGLKTRRPELDVELTLSSNRELLNKLRSGELDAIVIAMDDEKDTGTDTITVPVLTDEICFAAPRHSGYATCAEIELKKLGQENFVCLSEDFATHRDFNHAFRLAGFSPRIIMQVGDIFSLTNLVSGGVGYTLLPGRMADFNPQVQLIRLAAPYRISQHISLLLPRNRERDPNLLALMAECRLLATRKSRPFGDTGSPLRQSAPTPTWPHPSAPPAPAASPPGWAPRAAAPPPRSTPA